MSILIVEDNRQMRRMLTEMVRSAFKGRLVLAAADGKSALMMCRNISPQLVLVDVGLPDTNGIELLIKIRTLLPATKVVVVSSHYDSAHRDAAQAAGAVAYLVKDEIYDKLVPALNIILEDRPN